MYASIGFIPGGPVTFTFDDKCLPGKVIFSPCEARVSIDFHLDRADVEALRDAVVAFLDDADSDPRDCEPDCTCQRVDVDRDDAFTCELHNLSSQWNRDCRAYENAHPKPEAPPCRPSRNPADIRDNSDYIGMEVSDNALF